MKFSAWAEESGLDVPHRCPVSVGLISPLESSPRARSNASGLEGKGITFMGRGKVSRTPANLQDLPRWFCLAPAPKAEARIFISSILHMLRAGMGHGVGRELWEPAG